LLIDVTKRGGTETKLTINKFDREIVDFTITFEYPREYGERVSDEEKEITKNEVKDYFKSKCREWMNVLRSAVGGKERDLKLTFTVEDHTSEDIKIYSLTHEDPSNPVINPENIRDEIFSEKSVYL